VVKEIIQRKIGKRVRIIDSSVAAADAVRARIDHDSDLDRRLGKNGNAAFYLSDVTPHFQDAARKILGRPIRVARAEIPASI
jgi:glutamate racemase